MMVLAPPLTQTPLPVPKLAPVGYFEKSWPVNLILGSFFAVTLPMAAITLFSGNGLIPWIYVWLFGITHFAITLTIYCQSANLKYFASTRRTAVIFFAVPALIFMTFDLLHAFRVSATWPTLALIFFTLVRCFDFFHFNRQTFGVLQMFKGRTKAKYDASLRTMENRYLLLFVALMMATFLSGGVCPLLIAGGPLSLASLQPLVPGWSIDLAAAQVAWVGLFALTMITMARAMLGHRRMLQAGTPGAGAAMMYALLQAAGAMMAAIYFPLYLAALALHYVEYHILMAPRVFQAKLDSDNRLDRTFGKLRSHPVLFYILLILFSAIITGGAFVGMNAAMGAPISDFTSPIGTLMLIAIFDGIFVFHYFVEMYIWKFSDPHFRNQMHGLYFSPKTA